MSKPKIQSFQLIKDLLEKSAREGTPTKGSMPKISREETKILFEATGVDFTDTLDKIGALED
jgi:hypothetical protein